MKRINSLGLLSGLLTASMLVGCTGDDTTATSDTEGEDSTSDGADDGMTMPMTTAPADDTGTSDGGETGTTTDMMTTDDGPMESGSSDDGPPDPVPVDMFLEITNISGDAVTFSPISPGVWLNHGQGGEIILVEDAPDPGEGIEELAEDGDPGNLADAIMDNMDHLLSGIFNTPEGADDPAPIGPGESYRVEFTAEPFSRMSMAMMLVGSNDQMLATGEPGIGMFAGGGQPQGVRDVTNLLRVWDAGTEVNQGPSQGPWQALHGGSPNMGAPEDGGVFAHNDSTRAIPLPVDMIDVEVTQGDGMDTPLEEFTITITNTSYERGTLVTPLSDFFWMTHDDTVTMFETGAAASAGIESLAEDGITAGLEGEFTAGAGGVGEAAAIAGPFLPGDAKGPGDSITFVVNGDAATPWLSFATMVVQSNDAFLAPPATGVRLFDEDDTPRDNEDVRDDILRVLTVWDAGTEANETPGVGLNQVLRQGDTPNVGPADADTNVRIYQDVGSDLAGDSLGGVITVSITEDDENAGSFIVRLENTSDTTGYPAVLTPAFYMLHDDSVMMFEVGSDASPGLEALAEDGGTAGIVGEWDGSAGVLLAQADNQPLNEAMDVLDPGPLQPGEFYEFSVTPDDENRFFSFAQMVVPSNDTFAAFGSGGIALLDSMGDVRSDEAIAADIASDLVAWDAGTEGNQAGAAGRDQPPRQAGDDTGQGNGSGLVRVHEDGPGNVVIWSAPQPNQLVRVTLGPVEK